jgi:hypothetical protein
MSLILLVDISRALGYNGCMNREKTMKVYIGDVVTVVWSNGAGESDFRVVENEIGPSTFELVAEREFGEGVDDGDFDADDWAAVVADAKSRRAWPYGGVVE